ncbi:MAG TPA: DUF4382 domain-containing protein [Holophagaceae bacterium]|nr:DUF4382 domain-containing protein [Holophagaceae bacterium]
MTRFRFGTATAFAVASISLFTACGGGGSSSSQSAPAGKVDFLVADAPSDAWSAVNVVLKKVALVPQGGGTPVVIYDQSSDPTPDTLNLVHLDELADLLTSASVPVGTYTKVLVQIDPTSVSLVDNQMPSHTYDVASGTVKVVGLPGFLVDLSAPLVVTEGQSTQVQLDFDLGSPLFILDRPGMGPAGADLYLVNFERCVRHRPIANLAGFLLRHLRGQVADVTGTTLTLHTEHRGRKVIDVDAVNGTRFYDLDQSPVTPTTGTAYPASLTTGKYVRVAARFQGSGQLTAVRVWFSADRSKLRRFSPEGHVVAVDTVANTLKVLWNPMGEGTPMALTTFNVDAGTNFFFHDSASAIGTGTAFLPNMAPGFKVQMTVADPTAMALTASAVDIERAHYEGTLALTAGNSGLTFTNPRYSKSADFAAADFAWWNFTYPTLANSGSDSLVSLLSGLPANTARGASSLTWNGGSSAWNAQDAILLPIAQKGQITGALSGSTFTFTPTGGSAEAVDLSSTAGSATLVYQVSVQNGIVTVAPLDSSQWNATTFAAGTPARIFAVPTAGNLRAYVVTLGI